MKKNEKTFHISLQTFGKAKLIQYLESFTGQRLSNANSLLFSFFVICNVAMSHFFCNSVTNDAFPKIEPENWRRLSMDKIKSRMFLIWPSAMSVQQCRLLDKCIIEVDIFNTINWQRFFLTVEFVFICIFLDISYFKSFYVLWPEPTAPISNPLGEYQRKVFHWNKRVSITNKLYLRIYLNQQPMNNAADTKAHRCLALGISTKAPKEKTSFGFVAPFSNSPRSR